MSYRLPENWSLESLADYVVGVIAGLGAVRFDTAGALDRWQALRRAIRTARDLRDDARDAETAASRRVSVRDAEWDATITELSGVAFLAAGKDAAAAPYAPLFGTVTAADARNLGPHKATAFGKRTVALGRREAHPALVQALDALSAANDALDAASKTRDAAVLDALANDVERRKLLNTVEQVVAETEIAILTAMPGRRDLVRALLAPQRRESRAAPEPDAVTA